MPSTLLDLFWPEPELLSELLRLPEDDSDRLLLEEPEPLEDSDWLSLWLLDSPPNSEPDSLPEVLSLELLLWLVESLEEELSEPDSEPA